MQEELEKKIGAKKALCSGLDLSSQSVAQSVLLALRRFKTLFGKGRVGSTSLQRPEQNAFLLQETHCSLKSEEKDYVMMHAIRFRSVQHTILNFKFSFVCSVDA